MHAQQVAVRDHVPATTAVEPLTPMQVYVRSMMRKNFVPRCPKTLRKYRPKVWDEQPEDELETFASAKYEPSPDDIAAACQQIQAGWSEEERRRRWHVQPGDDECLSGVIGRTRAKQPAVRKGGEA